MKVEETYLKGCFVITPKVFNDERGCFFESFNKAKFKKLTGVTSSFIQDNQSTSSKGVLRGLHFQTGDFEQAKLVRVVKGEVLDVCVDLRKESSTFGKHFSIILSGKDNKQLYIPKGFAHGFITLVNNTVFAYKCDNYYNKASEKGIIYNDQTLKINWGFPEKELLLSKKDLKLPTFETFLNDN